MFHRLFHAILFSLSLLIVCNSVCFFHFFFTLFYSFASVFLPFARLTLQLVASFFVRSLVPSFILCCLFFSLWNFICPARFLLHLLYIPQCPGEHHLNHQNSYKNTFITFAFLSTFSSFSISCTLLLLLLASFICSLLLFSPCLS